MNIIEIPASPMAKAIPSMSAAEYASLMESVKRLGKIREKIVLIPDDENGIETEFYPGVKVAVLDGMHRQKACVELKMIPRYRMFGDEETDGASAMHFVIDKNMERRHLSIAQKAAAATNALPHFQKEAELRRLAGLQQGTKPKELTPAAPVATASETPPADSGKGKAAAEAAGAFHVSTRTVEAAAEVKKEAPDEFKKLEEGTTTVNAAVQVVKKKKAETPASAEDESARVGGVEENKAKITAACGEEFATAVFNGTILKTVLEMRAFVSLSEKEMAEIKELIIRGWLVKKALSFMSGEVKRTDEISTLFLRANATKAHEFTVDGWKITVERISQPESGQPKGAD